MEVNPERLLVESNYDNNLVVVKLECDPSCDRPGISRCMFGQCICYEDVGDQYPCSFVPLLKEFLESKGSTDQVLPSSSPSPTLTVSFSTSTSISPSLSTSVSNSLSVSVDGSPSSMSESVSITRSESQSLSTSPSPSQSESSLESPPSSTSTEEPLSIKTNSLVSPIHSLHQDEKATNNSEFLSPLFVLYLTPDRATAHFMSPMTLLLLFIVLL
jgi:hypothetical protein